MCIIDIKQFKYNIENNSNIDNINIFCGKNDFIFNQYLHAYANNNDYSIVTIEDLSEVPKNSLFSSVEDIVYKLKISKLKYVDVNNSAKMWIIADYVDNNIESSIGVIHIPKLEEWHKKDYIKTNCPFLSEDQIDKLLVYKDLYRIDIELDKLKIVENFSSIEDQLFIDSTDKSVFDIINSIVQRDKAKLVSLSEDISRISVSSFGLVKLLLDNFRHVIDIQLAKNSTPEYVGVTANRFWAISKYSCNHYTKEELIYIYKLLCSVDSDIKSGKLPESIAVDYIITKIMLL